MYTFIQKFLIKNFKQREVTLPSPNGGETGKDREK